MTIPRYNPKRDEVELAIVHALNKSGVQVLRLDKFDLLCLRGKNIYMLECKSEGGHFTHPQELMIASGWPLKVVHNAAEALQAVGL